ARGSGCRSASTDRGCSHRQAHRRAAATLACYARAHRTYQACRSSTCDANAGGKGLDHARLRREMPSRRGARKQDERVCVGGGRGGRWRGGGRGVGHGGISPNAEGARLGGGKKVSGFGLLKGCKTKETSPAEIFCIWSRALPRFRPCRASLGRKPIRRGRYA